MDTNETSFNVMNETDWNM